MKTCDTPIDSFSYGDFAEFNELLQFLVRWEISDIQNVIAILFYIGHIWFVPIKFVYAGGRRLVVVIIICTFENEMLLTGKKRWNMKWRVI